MSRNVKKYDLSLLFSNCNWLALGPGKEGIQQGIPGEREHVHTCKPGNEANKLAHA